MAEGGGLLNRCTVSSRTVSSNLIPSANFAYGYARRAQSAAVGAKADAEEKGVGGGLRQSIPIPFRCPAQTTAIWRSAAIATITVAPIRLPYTVRPWWIVLPERSHPAGLRLKRVPVMQRPTTARFGVWRE